MDGLTVFINDAPLLLIAALLFLFLCLLREVGGWLRRRVAPAAGDLAEESSDKGYLFSGLLGLLALLIAFTFSLAVERYEGRRKLVVEEANAIGTAEMRAHLLPAPGGDRLAGMLQDYARTRDAYGRAGVRDRPALAQASAAKRSGLQTAALATLEPVVSTPLGPFVGQSINAVLDVGVEREALNDARVPLSIVRALVLYALLTSAMLGYGLTGPRARHRGTTIIFFGLLTLAIVLILDLDRPQAGSIRIDGSPMSQLVAGFPPESATAATPPALGSYP